MQSFAKVLSGVPKKMCGVPVARPRILLPVDSRAFALGKLGIAIFGPSAGQGRSEAGRGAGTRGQGQARGGLKVSLSQFVRFASGAFPGERSLLASRRAFVEMVSRGLETLKTKLGFVNFWKVNSLKGISAQARNCGQPLAFSSSIGADDLATGQGREELKKCESF